MSRDISSKIVGFSTEFEVNDYITLKLEGKSTVIYVDGEKFDQCKFLVLSIPVEKIQFLTDLMSIDEAAEVLDTSLEWGDDEGELAPEVEFWAHCSNMQAWAEHNYDTRLLHRNLVFPLLKRLADVGDPIAERVFKEEIAKRLLSDHPSVVNFLLEEYYISDYLTQEELASLYDDFGPNARKLGCVVNGNEFEFIKEGRLYLDNMKIKSILDVKGLEHLENLRELYFSDNLISDFKGLDDLQNLDILCIAGNRISEIKELNNLINLKELYLSNNKISEIEGLENLQNLKVLKIENNKISEIGGLENLTNLKWLYLADNQITEIKGLDNLQNLEILFLKGNQISEINGLDNLTNLHFLSLEENRLSEIKGLDNLENLSTLYLSNNQIKEIKGLDCLIKMSTLNIIDNPISKLNNLTNNMRLQDLYLSLNQISEIHEFKRIGYLIDKKIKNNFFFNHPYGINNSNQINLEEEDVEIIKILGKKNNLIIKYIDLYKFQNSSSPNIHFHVQIESRNNNAY